MIFKYVQTGSGRGRPHELARLVFMAPDEVNACRAHELLFVSAAAWLQSHAPEYRHKHCLEVQDERWGLVLVLWRYQP
jgi:hypothetical protein